jgi:hypothetical protein
VAKVQTGYKPQPLVAFPEQPPPVAGPAIDFPKIEEAMLLTGEPLHSRP